MFSNISFFYFSISYENGSGKIKNSNDSFGSHFISSNIDEVNTINSVTKKQCYIKVFKTYFEIIFLYKVIS